jgi:hypothetical protein
MPEQVLEFHTNAVGDTKIRLDFSTNSTPLCDITLGKRKHGDDDDDNFNDCEGLSTVAQEITEEEEEDEEEK